MRGSDQFSVISESVNEVMSETNDETMETVLESVAASEMGVPLARLREWRREGVLMERAHWVKEGRQYALTVEGIAEVRRRVGLEEADALPGVEEVPVLVQVGRQQGANPRLLRGFELTLDGGGGIVDRRRATVRLITPRVFTAQFKAGMRIEVRRTEAQGIFEYHGARPRVRRL